MLLEWSGAKVYMTRAALRELAAELLRISDADPKECFEVHLSHFFSEWPEDGELSGPTTRFTNGLAPVFDRVQREFLTRELEETGDMIEFWEGEPGFDVTIMHIPAESIREESERPNE